MLEPARQAAVYAITSRHGCGVCGLVDTAGVVAGSEVVVAGDAVGEQVPDDDQNGAGNGDQGLELAAALDYPPVPRKVGSSLGRSGPA
jgi:hypothetical protein